MTSPFFDHDDESEEFVHLDLSDLGCGWCIGGFAPAGTHPVLGLVYVACMHCTDICPCCGGTALIPADSTCRHCLTDALTVVGYTATFCHTCAGILAVVSIHDVKNVDDAQNGDDTS